MELMWKDALLASLERQLNSLRDETTLNEDAVRAMATVYSEGWKDCLRWLASEGILANG